MVNTQAIVGKTVDATSCRRPCRRSPRIFTYNTVAVGNAARQLQKRYRRQRPDFTPPLCHHCSEWDRQNSHVMLYTLSNEYRRMEGYLF